ncbi:MAG: hypothetical protein A2W05_08755 [Candidatus Schekmanbacteria bacterium RBG_16_38_10]|uniref:HEPN domain-containing protein n=1 Tax=Candidatus Schekmanbacteria bacterium RBG_16_38_10 TaxID=1817879 RepID=A0A1F7RM62_9BACT|nr:MAG: hypothetical protein A2W05_08755 [Candidatus Schekmanbacteria bacterium RBG_16_38_10]
MKEENLILIRYRLEQADASIKEAQVLLEKGMSLRSVMNTLYYAMFYAVLALLQEKQLGTAKHTGAISLFDREYIKTSIFDKELSKTLHRAFELRQKGDYMEQVEVTQSDIDEMVLKATDFVNKVKGYLRLPDNGQ